MMNNAMKETKDMLSGAGMDENLIDAFVNYQIHVESIKSVSDGNHRLINLPVLPMDDTKPQITETVIVEQICDLEGSSHGRLIFFKMKAIGLLKEYNHLIKTIFLGDECLLSQILCSSFDDRINFPPIVGCMFNSGVESSALPAMYIPPNTILPSNIKIGLSVDQPTEPVEISFTSTVIITFEGGIPAMFPLNKITIS